MKSNRIVVSGYYGFNNIGDEAILKGLVDGVRSLRPETQFCVLSKYPEFTALKYDVDSIGRMDFSDIYRELKRADVFISGGGSLLQDATSKKSILYYLSLIKIASLLNCKTVIYSQGIGPISNSLNRKLAKHCLNSVDLLNVRDEQSLEYVKNLKVRNNILLTTDSVFGINTPDKEIGISLLKKKGVSFDKRIIGINILDWKDYGFRTINEFEKFLDIILKKDLNIVLLPLYYYRDLNFQKTLYDRLNHKFKNLFILDDYLYIDEYLSVIGNFDIMISMRLHGLIFSTLMNAVPIGISYDPKIDGFMRELKREKPQHISQFDYVELLNTFEQALENIDALKHDTFICSEKFKLRSKLHNEAIINLMRE